MELSTVVLVIVIAIMAVVIMKILKKAASFAFSIAGIIAVVWLVIAGMRYLDENNLRKNLLESNSLYLLEDQGDIMAGFATIQGNVPTSIEEIDDPVLNIHDSFYKVFLVRRDSMEERTALVLGAADDKDRLELFKNYIDNNLLQNDFVTKLVQKEKQGQIKVYKETIAFKHGFSEVLGK
ncbi:hypothetical protein HQ545_08030 [Candidatus Woesearchaeota archaeon]|nr:hypothetical protein [Candidatus Woesearchaeota archaeon]